MAFRAILIYNRQYIFLSGIPTKISQNDPASNMTGLSRKPNLKYDLVWMISRLEQRFCCWGKVDAVKLDIQYMFDFLIINMISHWGALIVLTLFV